MSFDAKMLQSLTLDAIKAKSLGQHMRAGDDKSPFNPAVSTVQRLATLTEHITAVFHHSMILSDPIRLQNALLELSASAATWAELLDIAPCRCPEPGVVCWRHIELREGDPAK